MEIEGKPITGLSEIEKDGDFYLVRKEGSSVIALMEKKNGIEKVDVSEFFESAERWKWGIKTENWYGVFLTAIRFKAGHLVLDVENVIVSIKKRGDIVYINAIVFGRTEEKAIEDAQRFKLDNREYIAFEMSNEYYEFPLKGNIESIFENINKALEEIKERAQETVEKTQKVFDQSELILREIREIKEKLNILPVLEERIKKLEGNREDFSVQVISEKGVYIDGEKVYVNLLGEIFDYLKVDTRNFLSFFGLPSSLLNRIDKKLQETAKAKYLEGKREITWEEAEFIAERPVKKKSNWRIVLEFKDKNFKKLISILRSKLKIGESRLEELLHKAIERAIGERRDKVFLHDLIEVANEKEKELFRQLTESIQEIMIGGKKDFELKDKAVIVAEEGIADLLLYAIALEVERRTGKGMEVKK